MVVAELLKVRRVPEKEEDPMKWTAWLMGMLLCVGFAIDATAGGAHRFGGGAHDWVT